MSSAPSEEFDLGAEDSDRPTGAGSGDGRGGLLRGSAIIAAALGFTQLLAYVLSVTAAKTLQPDAFGSFGALLNLVLIGTVLAFGLQAVVARLVVTTPDAQSDHLGTRVLGFAFRIAAIVGAILLALSPAIALALRQPSVWPVVFAVLMLPPLTIAGCEFGLAQGHERHGRLAALLLINGVLRYAFGMAGLLGLGSVVATYAAMCLGTWVGAAVGLLLVRPMAGGTPLRVPGLRSQVLHASHALLALYVATSIDVLLARFWLPGAESGVYAVGALVSKVAFWLPSFVAVVTFPRMADERRGQTTVKAAAAVAGIGAIIVLGLALLPDLVLGLVAGPGYDALGPYLWLFGLIGSAFSLAQFLLYSRIAVDDRSAVVALWISAALIVAGVAVWHGSFAAVAAVVAAVAVALALVGVLDLVRDNRRERLAGNPEGLAQR